MKSIDPPSVEDGVWAKPRQLFFKSDGATPNNPFPVLLYALQFGQETDCAAAFEALFARHQWTPLWRSGIFDYQHYHSTAHEALGVAHGSAHIMLGGEAGLIVELKPGDALILPAGTGHRCLQSSRDFQVVGAYSIGQEDYDIQRPSVDTHAASLARIAKVSRPRQDPVAGAAGALLEAWGRGPD